MDLKFATVDAPISGRIDQALITEGALVSPTDTSPMARIQQVDQVYVDVRQPATSLDAVRQALASPQADRNSGLPVTVLRSDGTPYDAEAQKFNFDRTADPATKSGFAGSLLGPYTGSEVIVPAGNHRRDLLPGMFVRARVPRATYADSLMVPQQAVARVGGKPLVWVIGEGDTVRAQPVELGELIERRYRIRAGLAAGQRIVVEGAERLSEGAIVTPHDWKPADMATR